jgi:hypothetical protein
MRPHPYRVEMRDDGPGIFEPTWMNRRMWAAWDVTVDKLGWAPVVTQGAYMRAHGGGAEASAGYHDFGGCIDTSVIGLSKKDKVEVMRVGRSVGWAVWNRIAALDNMPSDHMHWVLLDDERAAPGALGQMTAYRNGLDGLAGGRKDRDAELTPDPIKVFNYDTFIDGEEDMMNLEDPIPGTGGTTVGQALRSVVKLEKAFDAFRATEKVRNKVVRDQIKATQAAVDQLPDAATKEQVKQMLRNLDATVQLVVQDDDNEPVNT